MLELPERAQQLIGEGVIALSAVDQLRAIGAVAPALLDALIAYLRRRQRVGGRAARARARLGPRRRAAHDGDKKVFAAYLDTTRAARDRRAAARQEDRRALRAGREAAQAARPLRLRAAADPLHRRRRRPGARRRRADRVRARHAPIIVDRSLYRELVKAAIKRTHDELQAKAATAAAEEKQARAQRREQRRPDPLAAAKRERDAQLRELADQAHGANLDLGAAPARRPQRRRPGRHATSRGSSSTRCSAPTATARPYTQTGERVAAARRRRHPARDRRAAHRRHQDPQGRQPRAGCGSTTATTATPGRGRVAVEVHRRRQDRGRALRPRAGRDRRRAARHPAGRPRQPAHARRPAGARTRTSPPRRWRKLAGPHLPASLKRLEQAVERAHAGYEQAEQAHRARAPSGRRETTTRRTATPRRRQISTAVDDAGAEPEAPGEPDATDAGEPERRRRLTHLRWRGLANRGPRQPNPDFRGGPTR